MASAELAKIIAALRTRPIATDTSWEQRRAAMEEMQAGLELPGDVECRREDAGGVPVEWLAVPTGQTVPAEGVLFYLHGGGYALGSIATHRDLMQRLARAAGGRVLGVDYRLAPEHPFPAALDDAVRAYRWLQGEGVPANRIVIAGDSAGGGLALATALRLRHGGEQLPAGLVVLSPWTDLAGTGDSLASRQTADPMVTIDGLQRMADAYLGGVHPAEPLASPLYADLSALPPMLIQVGDAEVLLDDSVRLAERAERAGVDVTLQVWEEMIHVFQAFPMLPESAEAIERIGAFVQGCWNQR